MGIHRGLGAQVCGVVPRCLSLARSGHRQQKAVAADEEKGAWLEARSRAVDFEPPKSSNRPKRRAILPHHAVLVKFICFEMKIS